jgi:hypothetical protein
MAELAENINHYIVFEINGNLQETVYKCESKLLFYSSDCRIVYKNILTTNNETINLFITFDNDFVRGFLYFNNKEYILNNYCLYRSIQINNWCYDNLAICSLTENFI